MTPDMRHALHRQLGKLLSSVTGDLDEQARLAGEVISLVWEAQHAPDVETFLTRADEVLAAHERAWELSQLPD
jgi:hypothetical protein